MGQASQLDRGLRLKRDEICECIRYLTLAFDSERTRRSAARINVGSADCESQEQKRIRGEAFTKLKSDLRDKRRELSQVESELILLSSCIASANMQLEIARYHYDRFQKIKDKTPSLSAAKISQKLGGDGYVNAISINAEVIAFLKTLHARLDSFPFILNLIIRKFSIDSRDLGWNKQTLSAYAPRDDEYGLNLDFYQKLVALNLDPKFGKLRDIVNLTKHRHSIPIFWNGTKIVFRENFISGNAGDPIEVEQFLVDCHDTLLDKLDDLFASLEKFLLRQLSEMK